ncbi:virion morphogenesis protein [Pasteurellaceae bacterium Macca]|nr:virion morphogenesis protein [Pasteurellaceae bacterium Macca]
MIEIKVNNLEQLTARLDKLSEGAENLTPLMKKFSGTMQTAVDKNFEAGGRPAWLGIKHRKGTPLNDSGQLKNSIQSFSDRQSAVVGTNVKYAAIHHFGGKTKPHKIKPVFKKGLTFNDGVYKSVDHPGSVIPARPFLQLTPEDEAQLIDDAQSYFQGLIK